MLPSWKPCLLAAATAGAPTAAYTGCSTAGKASLVMNVVLLVSGLLGGFMVSTGLGCPGPAMLSCCHAMPAGCRKSGKAAALPWPALALALA